jgi:predicted site-specific integrase-resolvase
MSNVVELKPNIERKLYKANEVKEMFGVNRSTLNSWMHRGILTKHKHIGKLLYFDREEVDALAKVY